MKLFKNVKNNIRLLEDDIITAFTKAKNSPKDSIENFKTENRREVLYLYRHMLKYIPPMCERKLERVHLHEVFLD